ncbi:MAG TPA: alpha/beta fold hydrolase [Streptosporangiaceae bacterium]
MSTSGHFRNAGHRNGSTPTVLLVHGAFADVSIWVDVIAELQAAGIGVIALANPLRSLESDAAYIARAAAAIDGPVLLAGHSYGGAVITVAGARAGNVVGLIYVAAFALDEGESALDITGLFPGSQLTGALRPAAFPDTSGDPAIELYIDREAFHRVFAADLPRRVAAVAAAAQRPITAVALEEKSPSAGWKTKPAWYVIATEDQVISPEAQQFMADRCGARTVEIRASHAVTLTQPAAVARQIVTAAAAPRTTSVLHLSPEGIFMSADKSSNTTTITEHETMQVDRANSSGLTPVMFVHGLFLLPTSWDRWAELFEVAGYVALTPGWPDDPDTAEEAREHPEVLAGKSVGQVADHFAAIAGSLSARPVVVGHSFGGLLAQIMAGRGLAAATVAIDPAPFRGVLPLPISALRVAGPALSNPANRHRAVPLTYDQFRYAFANAVSEDEAKRLYETYAVPAAALPLFQGAAANLNPWTEAKVDTENADRGPMLLIAGEKDHTAPPAITHASFKLQQRNPGVTEMVEMPGRGHALTIDNGWREVADTALAFVQRFTSPQLSETGRPGS